MVVFICMQFSHAPTLLRGIALVHMAEHPREVLGIVATSSREDGERRIPAIVRVASPALLQRLVLLHELLRSRLISPEIGRRHHRFEFFHSLFTFLVHIIWSRLPGLNWGPTVYDTVALPTELRRQHTDVRTLLNYHDFSS